MLTCFSLNEFDNCTIRMNTCTKTIEYCRLPVKLECTLHIFSHIFTIKVNIQSLFCCFRAFEITQMKRVYGYGTLYRFVCISVKYQRKSSKLERNRGKLLVCALVRSRLGLQFQATSRNSYVRCLKSQDQTASNKGARSRFSAIPVYIRNHISIEIREINKKCSYLIGTSKCCIYIRAAAEVRLFIKCM